MGPSGADQGEVTLWAGPFHWYHTSDQDESQTWRWQQDAPWLNDYPPSAVCNVSIPWALWGYLINEQDKVTFTNPPYTWSDPDMELPPRFDENLAGLRLALQLYNDGQSKAHRRRFITELAKTTGMRHAWFRTLALELKK